MNDNLSPKREWHPDAVMSIYKPYPNKQDRATSMKRIREALDRICEGEIDSKPRTQAQALAFLRQKVHEARVAMIGRERKWIPHSATWFNQSRYLQLPTAVDEQLPEQLEACIKVLAFYPKTTSQAKIRADVKGFLPALRAIDGALKEMALPELVKKVRLYKQCVDDWPKDEWRYIPSPARWFSEKRFGQDEAMWRRQSAPVFTSEREQIARVIGQK